MTGYKLRTGVAAVAVALLALAGCGDDEDNGGAQPAAEGTDDIARYCDASLAIETVPDPDVDETASSEEIQAALADHRDTLRPLADDVLAVTPDEIADDLEVLSAAVDELGASDEIPFDEPEVAAASRRVHAFDLEHCGWEQVDVTMTDYHFDASLPASSGPVSFELTNEGDEFHVAIVGRKKDSVPGSAEEAFAAADSEEAFNQSFEFVTEEAAPPGAGAYTVADLSPGEYVLFCPVPVGSTEAEGDGPPHFTQGMVETFTIK